jgi:hypothetical protein
VDRIHALIHEIFLMLFATYLATSVAANPDYIGNCLTQRINFTDPSRTFALDGLPSMNFIRNLDVSRYDMTIDYHTDLVRLVAGGGVELTIRESTSPTTNPYAPRMSTTRLMLYGRVTAVLRAPPVHGVVTTFITMGPHLPDEELDLTWADKQGGDEIDWEIVGGDPENAQTNIFYRGIREFAVRGGYHPVPGTVAIPQKYTIDWKHDHIIFSLNDTVQRIYHRNSSEADSYHTPNRRFFPDRAGKVQFAVWSERTNAWAGGSPIWPNSTQSASAFFEYIDIQCYDDNDRPVPKWPLTVDNPDARPSIRFQPTRGVNAAIPPEAAPGFTGVIRDPNAPLTTGRRAIPTPTGAQFLPLISAELRTMCSAFVMVAALFASFV